MSKQVAEVNEVSLHIEILNKQPLELTELTKCFIALSNQFNDFVAKNATSEKEREARLYVKEIKSGSVIVDLMEYATVGMIPFLENVNTIAAFAEYCKNVIQYFLKREGEKPELSVTDCKELSQIISPVAKDNGAQFNMSVNVNGKFQQFVFLDSNESNALQNILHREIGSQLSAEIKEFREKVVMAFYQTRSKLSSDTGNKAVIDDIIKGKPVNVFFEPDDLKKAMLKGEENPNNYVFVVDVKVETVGGKVVAYRVVKLHETMSME